MQIECCLDAEGDDVDAAVAVAGDGQRSRHRNSLHRPHSACAYLRESAVAYAAWWPVVVALVVAHSLRHRKLFQDRMHDSTPRKPSPRRRAQAGSEGGNRLLLVVVLHCIVLDRMVRSWIPGSCLARSDSRNDAENRAEKLIRLVRDDVAATHGEDVAVHCSILVQAVVGAAGRSL